jgi:hypothetical protein
MFNPFTQDIKVMVKSSKDVERTPFEKLVRQIRFKSRPRNIISYFFISYFKFKLNNPKIKLKLL